MPSELFEHVYIESLLVVEFELIFPGSTCHIEVLTWWYIGVKMRLTGIAAYTLLYTQATGDSQVKSFRNPHFLDANSLT